ncbi:MAG: hypothetical protein LBG64_04200 [Pseudomonadales bacterium]|jgi:acyl carrier protein|nr:hypothetical protein [Pseudomonadales bacterium]
MPNREEITNLVTTVLAEVTFNDPNDFQLQSVLAVELNLTKDDIVNATKKISQQLDISPNEIERAIGADEIETVADLVDAVIEEMELG